MFSLYGIMIVIYLFRVRDDTNNKKYDRHNKIKYLSLNVVFRESIYYIRH